MHVCFCRENRERFPGSPKVLQSPHVPSNDIYYNVLRRPQLNESTGVMEWGIHQSEFPCILDLLRQLQDVTSAPSKLAALTWLHDFLKVQSVTESNMNAQCQDWLTLYNMFCYS